MSDSNSPTARDRSTPLAGAPVVRRGGQWWLITSAGSLLATDPTFTGELDRFAAAKSAADRAVAQLRADRGARRRRSR
ncbi:hypothetical protein ACFVXG_27975 [Kitasatospora sp. NPDC058162]|uniref:hypothetical protein n=1 Tax=Kitasatospora sp. NPDC058162 TaxID=3346362 RepID=UPI0036DE76F9